jgi:hypothetical protein
VCSQIQRWLPILPLAPVVDEFHDVFADEIRYGTVEPPPPSPRHRTHQGLELDRTEPLYTFDIQRCVCQHDTYILISTRVRHEPPNSSVLIFGVKRLLLVRSSANVVCFDSPPQWYTAFRPSCRVFFCGVLSDSARKQTHGTHRIGGWLKLSARASRPPARR